VQMSLSNHNFAIFATLLKQKI